MPWSCTYRYRITLIHLTLDTVRTILWSDRNLTRI